jgi:hypothetical protein
VVRAKVGRAGFVAGNLWLLFYLEVVTATGTLGHATRTNLKLVYGERLSAQVDAIKAQKDAGGMAQGKRTDLVEHHDQVNDKPTLADVGISKDLSSRAQKIASIMPPVRVV